MRKQRTGHETLKQKIALIHLPSEQLWAKVLKRLTAAGYRLIGHVKILSQKKPVAAPLQALMRLSLNAVDLATRKASEIASAINGARLFLAGGGLLMVQAA